LSFEPITLYSCLLTIPLEKAELLDARARPYRGRTTD
jgi:hypothetical protein